ncbi:MAG: hypothetical protein MJY99_10705 [Fibrobacter sp.]|nr:hypothetical protein [Fibrobacter sp.]
MENTGRAFIISQELRGSLCDWNFKGDTEKDFLSWCSLRGFRCGGNPFVVSPDSVYYAGERVHRSKVEFLERERLRLEDEEKSRLLDSVSSVLPLKSVNIEYLEIGSSMAERLGFVFSDYIAGAHFFGFDKDLFSVSLQAQSLGDSSAVYRSYSSVYDSTLTVFWGGKRDKISQSNITSNGLVSNNYVTETYGLTFRLSGLSYFYEHSTDYEHSINGAGRLDYGQNDILGVYQYSAESVRAVPFLSSLPLVGSLFSWSSRTNETRFVFIRVYLTMGV